MNQQTKERQDCSKPTCGLSQQTKSISTMIDIHCHILPAFDDGADNISESIAMAEIAAATGVGTIIATPHIGTDSNAQMSLKIQESVNALQQAIDNRGITLQILSGAEVFPSMSVIEWLDEGYPITLAGGKYILLDCPLTTVPIGLDQLVFELQSRKVTPIFAHPERILPIQRKPQLLEKLVQAGMLIQLDALSVIGRNGSAAAATIRVLLRHQWAHFLASDAHSPNHSRPQLARAAQMLIGLIGQDAVRVLVQDNPNRLLNGKTIPTDPLDYAPRRGLGILNLLLGNRK